MINYAEDYLVSFLLPSSRFQENRHCKLYLPSYCKELMCLPVTYDGFDASEMPSGKLDCDVGDNKDHGQVATLLSHPLGKGNLLMCNFM